MEPIPIVVQKPALAVIDLQKAMFANPSCPQASADVVRHTAQLADAMRERGGFVVLVRVASHDGRDMLAPDADLPRFNRPQVPDGSTIVDELGPKAGDYVLTKRQWGAFYGTDLDLQLRRRHLDTIILCGIATGIGVDTTAREAYARGYRQIFVEDAMAGLSELEHRYTVEQVFPRIGRVRSTAEVLRAIRG